MLQPKRTKFRKQHKGRIKGVAKGGYELTFGAYGLKAMEPERITARQIEAARRAMTRHMKRAGRVWIRMFPDVPVSKKPTEVRMGKGKGSTEYWACREKAAIMDLSPLRKYEVTGPDAEELMQACVTRNMKKLSVGQVVYTAMCYEHGGMIDDGTVYRLGDNNFRWVGGNDDIENTQQE